MHYIIDIANLGGSTGSSGTRLEFSKIRINMLFEKLAGLACCRLLPLVGFHRLMSASAEPVAAGSLGEADQPTGSLLFDLK